jgi:hypothetical protein
VPSYCTVRDVRTRIHVNQHVIRANAKTGAKDPVLTVKQGGRNRYAAEVLIDGPSTVVYRPDAPLSCGARVWVETDAPVRLVGEVAPPAGGSTADDRRACRKRS